MILAFRPHRATTWELAQQIWTRKSEYRQHLGHTQTYSEVMTRLMIPDHAEIRRQRIARRRRIDGQTICTRPPQPSEHCRRVLKVLTALRRPPCGY